MDTLSTGIGGALLAKALPEEWRGPRGVLAVSLASVVPDADVFADFLTGDPLADLTVHRGFTHSLVGVAVMAPLVALALWRFTRDKNYGRLLALATLGFLWHLFTDLATSWGTMVFYPFSRARVVWDLFFIIDLVFSGILLLPQLLAWIYRSRSVGTAGARRRGAATWLFLAALGALVTRLVSPLYGRIFAWEYLAAIAGGLALLFAAPALRGWGFRQSRTAFCRGGVVVFAAYAGLCVTTHALALAQVRQFADREGLQVVSAAALPQPLSPFRWSGLVLAPEGVYQSWFSVLDSEAPPFEFFPSDGRNKFIRQAESLPEVKTYLWFARFPVVRYREEGGLHIVEYTDRRFNAVRTRASPFFFRVTFNARGQVLGSGFVDRD